mmetsp:Transcript_14165/g.20880  ORF Transcript_14165/g.20880 Transcript_14165/m.20880 type:complete len:1338 (+) Transcript_14165:175-4188(+)
MNEGGEKECTSNQTAVYIQSTPHAWVPARIIQSSLSTNSTTLQVRVANYEEEADIQSDGRDALGGRALRDSEVVDVNLSDYEDGVLPLQNVDESGVLVEVEDMVDLPFLHEAAILYNLKARHMKGHPYTRTGDIVIAVNPYQWMDTLYSDDTRTIYADTLVWNVTSKEHKADDYKKHVKPHVYETSSLAYRGLAVDGINQSILVSGESGAGKTETVKILMSHLASVQASHTDATPATDVKESKSSFRTSPIVARVLDSNPLLEAFGNAKTIRNDNSSRFGKFIQLQFDTEDPIHASYAGKLIPSAVLAGSKCEVYLLEKSRVICHEEEERTYHIFYQLLAAPEEEKEEFWDGLVGTDNESFSYVGWTDTEVIEGKDDATRWNLTRQALGLVGVKGDRLKLLIRTICVVMQLGNLVFEPDPSNEEATVITSTEELDMLASLMGIDAMDIQLALTERTVTARNETFKVPLNDTKARDSCDAFAKEIYARIFHWLVRTINEATSAEKNYKEPLFPKQKKKLEGVFGTIGLLDIFGFESFDVNRFEQLCINYANEKLQQKFTLDIFRSVQSEYEFEGIELGEVNFADNSDVLDLIEGRMGLINVLNEECIRPKGNDIAFVTKIYTMNKDNEATCLIQDKFYRDYEFGLKHYAGPVTYDSTGFVTKNMDNLPSDLSDCAKKSTNELLSKEVGYADSEDPSSSSQIEKKKTPAKKRPPPRRPARGAMQRAGSEKKQSDHSSAPSGRQGLQRKASSSIVAETVWTKFRGQLTELMSNIGQTRTRYIRCIKPNTVKKPLVMQHWSAVEQLRCAGVVAAVTISRSAFPNRLEHEITLDRFAGLWHKALPEVVSSNHTSSTSLDDMEEDEPNKIRDDVQRLLTGALKQLEVVKGDKVTRGFVCGKTRTYFRAGALELLEAERLKSLGLHTVNMQRVIRGFVARVKFLKLRKAAIISQSRGRRVVARKKFKRARKACILIQCWLRCIHAGEELVTLRRNRSAAMIQTHWRMAVAITMLKKSVKSAAIIQAMVRGSIQRPIFRKQLKEAREEAKLENQLKALQRKLEEAEARRIEAEQRAKEAAENPPPAVNTTHQANVSETVASAQPAQQTETSSLTTASTASGAAASTAAKMAAAPVEEKKNEVVVPGQLTAQQQTLMDESGKMLEYLRKEVFKLRSQNSQLRKDFDLLKENNQRLMDANASAGASFAALNQHAKQLNKALTVSKAEVATSKQQVHKLNLAQVELKEELKMKTGTYIAEVHSRLQYQKTMGRIVDTIQERCRDSRLIEDVLAMSDECEMEFAAGGGDMHEMGPAGMAEPGGVGGSPSRAESAKDKSISARFTSYLWG